VVYEAEGCEQSEAITTEQSEQTALILMPFQSAVSFNQRL